MRNKTKAAVTINRLREKQEEWGGGSRGIFGVYMVLRGGTEMRGDATSPPLPFLQATNND